MDQIRVVGVDVGKTSFHVVDVDGYGVLQLKNRCSGAQLLALMAKLTDCLVAIESCCGADDLAWEIAPLGQIVRATHYDEGSRGPTNRLDTFR